MATDTGAPYNLPYPVGTDQPFVHLDIKALAEAVAAALDLQFDIDFSGPGMSNSGGATPPAGTRLLAKVGTATITSPASNVFGPVIFPTPFPNNVYAVFVSVYSGVGTAAVINGATNISKSEFSAFISGGTGATASFAYLALGW